MKIAYFDMDGVLANFSKGAGVEPGYQKTPDTVYPPAMWELGFYRNLEVMPGAKEAMAILEAHPGLEIHIASKPSTKALSSATEKLEWIEEHFPMFLRGRTHIIQNKGLLLGDYLIDDYLYWEDLFQGTFIRFDETDPIKSWKNVVNILTRDDSGSGSKKSKVEEILRQKIKKDEEEQFKRAVERAKFARLLSF